MDINETKDLFRLTLEAALKLCGRVIVSVGRADCVCGQTIMLIETWESKRIGFSHSEISCKLLDAVPYAGTSKYVGAGEYAMNLDCEAPSLVMANSAVCELSIELSSRLRSERGWFQIGTSANNGGTSIEMSINKS